MFSKSIQVILSILVFVAVTCNADSAIVSSGNADAEVTTLVNECGGYIEGLVGGINYKLYQNFTKQEQCIWTVHVPMKSTLEIRMVHLPKVQCTNCYFLDIFSMEKGTPELQKSISFTDLENNEVYNISGGPLYQIVFVGYVNVPMTGFALGLLGVGPDVTSSNANVYKVFEQKGAPTGLIKYIRTLETTQPSEIVSLNLHPEPGKQIQVSMSIVNGHPELYATPCHKYFGRLDAYEVAWSGGGLDDISLRSTECRTNHNTTITTPLPVFITYQSNMYLYGPNKDQFEIEWAMV